MTQPMTAERLAEIRERCDNATPGPWGVGNETTIALDVEQTSGSFRSTVRLAEVADDIQREDDARYTKVTDFASAEDDARFIAAARADVPDLLAEVDRLRAQLAALAARCEQGARDNGDYYNRTAAKYEHGKAVIWDHMATELRDLLAEPAPSEQP